MSQIKIDSKFKVKFPKEIIKKTNLQVGDCLEIEVDQNQYIVLHKSSEKILDQTSGILGPGPDGKDEVDSIRNEEEARLKELSVE